MAADLIAPAPFIIPASWGSTPAPDTQEDTERRRPLRPRIRKPGITPAPTRTRSTPTCADPAAHSGECDCAWAESKLSLVPPAFRMHVQRKYNAIKSRADRNNWLRRLVDVEAAHSTATEAERGALARLQAGARFQPAPFAWPAAPDAPQKTKYIDLSRHIANIVEMSDSDIKELARELAESEEIWLFDAREAAHHPRLEPRLRRYLRKASRQKKEMWALSLGLVGGKSWQNRAVSNMTLRHREQQIDAQIEWASRTKVTIESGEEIELLKIMSQNKKNRLAEIITITKGMEREGKRQGLQPVFITLTAPPRFHPNPLKGVNSWNGSSPEAGKNWLMDEWRRTVCAPRTAICSGCQFAG